MSFLLRLVALAFVLGWQGSSLAQTTVAIVLAEQSPPHMEMLAELRASLGTGGISPAICVLDWRELGNLPRHTNLIIAVGAKALDALAASDVPIPVLATLLPRTAFEKAIDPKHRNKGFSAVYLDQPAERQLNLLHLALPEHGRVAMLIGPDSSTMGALLVAAAPPGIHIDREKVSGQNELFSALQRVLPHADLLLAVPDPAIYNSQTIANILLTSYHYKIPVVGFSLAYVKAGALMALYSSPSQLGSQVGNIARMTLAGRQLPAPQYPKEFSVSINTYVARSFGLRLDDESSLRSRLHELEQRP